MVNESYGEEEHAGKSKGHGGEPKETVAARLPMTACHRCITIERGIGREYGVLLLSFMDKYM
jgi:hypothetical protein